MTGLRIGQIALRQDRGIKFLILAEIALLKSLAIKLVNLIEFQPRFRLKALEGPDRLGCQSSTIDQKHHALCNARFHQPINLIDCREGFACPSGHRLEHLALALGDGAFDRCIGFDLVRPQSRMAIGHGPQSRERAVKIAPHQFGQSTWRVKTCNPTRPVECMPYIAEPNHFAVCAI